MFRKLTLAATALSLGAGALVPLGAADAQRGYYPRGGYYDRSYYDRGYSDRGGYRGYDRGYSYRNCHKSGTTGTIIGAIAGGLLGRTIDTHGDRTTGTIIGGAAGALAGNAIEKSGRRGC